MATILIRYSWIRPIRGYRTIRAYDVIPTTILIVVYNIIYFIPLFATYKELVQRKYAEMVARQFLGNCGL